MREYYRQCKNILSEQPRTALEITRELFPEISDYEAYRKKETIKRALYQLKEDGLADSYRMSNKTFWASSLDLTKWERMSIQERIMTILDTENWKTTRQIASQVYDDFDSKSNGYNYTSRTNRNLHRMMAKGMVEHNTVLFSKFYLKVSAWRLADKEATA